MKIGKIRKGKANGKNCFLVDISFKEKRYRKFFKNINDAQNFLDNVPIFG